MYQGTLGRMGSNKGQAETEGARASFVKRKGSLLIVHKIESFQEMYNVKYIF